MVEAAFAIGALLTLVVAALEGWTTGHVSGQWLHDSVNRSVDRFTAVPSGTKVRAMGLNALAVVTTDV